ncbi:MAG: hypothetical protein KDH96_07595, partial [Candidatus Riesia sp.]|nr:hypothetical protein [Candidatus Riesia sp.]
KPDIGGFDTSDDQQLISPYTTIYTSALKRALKSYEKHPDSQSNIMYLIELYKHLDHDRKLSYQYGWGVPNVEDENLSYKRILRDIPNSKEIEQLYHKNKSKLLKGWLNI